MRVRFDYDNREKIIEYKRRIIRIRLRLSY